MVEATVRIVAPEEKRKELLDVLGSLQGPTEATKGCLGCHVLSDVSHESIVFYVVRWDDRRALEDHFRSERFRRLLPYIEMSLEPPQVEVNSLNHIGGLSIILEALGISPT